MMMRSYLLIAALCTASTLAVNLQCSLYQFALQGGFPCALQWWQNEDLGQVITVKNKMSTIVEDALKTHKVFDSVNGSLYGNINATSNDPFAKIIESGLTVEPYATFMVADILQGLEITASDLQKFGVPTDILNRDKQKEMIKEYFDFSCTNHGIKSFGSCMKTWINGNCGAEDGVDFLIKLVDKIQNFYCKGDTARDDLMSKLVEDLGQVFKVIPEFLGIVKNPNSPYLFDIAPDSFITNSSNMQKIIVDYNTKCGRHLSLTIDMFTDIYAVLYAPAGTILKKMKRTFEALSKCFYAVAEEQMPKLYGNTKLREHLDLMMARLDFSMSADTKIDIATVKRYSVTVYGDPHMLSYKATAPVTCNVTGLSIYAANEYFTLRGYASEAAPGSLATSVTMVILSFADSGVNYTSMGLTLSKTLNVGGNMSSTGTDTIKIASLGEVVQIVDENSGAIFTFRTYRSILSFTVRMGEKLFDNSYGLLVNGCPILLSTVSVGTASVGRRRRQTGACRDACAGVKSLYRSTCEFDCAELGDTSVAAIANGVEEMHTIVENKDTEILATISDDDDGPPILSASVQNAPNTLLLLVVAAAIKHLVN